MPIQYGGILDEHRAVRTAAGMFDLSHMGQFVATGDGVDAWLDRLTCNAVATMKPNQARYNVFTNERGGAHDDVIFYRLDGRWLLVVNAANTRKMWDHLSARARGSIRYCGWPFLCTSTSASGVSASRNRAAGSSCSARLSNRSG